MSVWWRRSGAAASVVAALERFEDGAAVLADGARLKVDSVIAATGYRPALEPLVGHLGILDERGAPLSMVRRSTHGRRGFTSSVTR
jgi:putative flavoprotein involved in K+ transport